MVDLNPEETQKRMTTRQQQLIQAQLKDTNVVSVTEPSDLRDSLKELNQDTIDDDGFTTIDMRTRLTASQLPALVGLDVMCLSGVYPSKFMRIGRSIKRLSVSIKGHGRKEMVDVVKGVRESEELKGKSIIERARSDS